MRVRLRHEKLLRRYWVVGMSLRLSPRQEVRERDPGQTSLHATQAGATSSIWLTVKRAWGTAEPSGRTTNHPISVCVKSIVQPNVPMRKGNVK